MAVQTATVVAKKAYRLIWITSEYSGKQYGLYIYKATGLAHGCTCPDRYYHKGLACKHMRDYNNGLKAAIALGKAAQVLGQKAAEREMLAIIAQAIVEAARREQVDQTASAYIRYEMAIGAV